MREKLWVVVGVLLSSLSWGCAFGQATKLPTVHIKGEIPFKHETGKVINVCAYDETVRENQYVIHPCSYTCPKCNKVAPLFSELHPIRSVQNSIQVERNLYREIAKVIYVENKMIAVGDLFALIQPAPTPAKEGFNILVGFAYRHLQEEKICQLQKLIGMAGKIQQRICDEFVLDIKSEKIKKDNNNFENVVTATLYEKGDEYGDVVDVNGKTLKKVDVEKSQTLFRKSKYENGLEDEFDVMKFNEM